MEGKKKGVPLQSRSGRGALRGPGEDRKRGAGGHPGGGHRKFIEKTGQRQYKRSTENRERQFEVEIPELKMEPRDTA